MHEPTIQSVAMASDQGACLHSLTTSSQDVDGVSRELEEVRRVNEQLVREVECVRGMAEEAAQGHSQQLQALREEMREVDNKHRKEVADANTQYRVSGWV